MKIILDGNKINSEDDFHLEISNQLKLPSWYGRNLDALWDVLTGMVGRPLDIEWINFYKSNISSDRLDKILHLLQDVKKFDISCKKDHVINIIIY